MIRIENVEFNAVVATRHPFLYVLCLPDLKAVYVGETADALGILGRIHGHLTSGGTLRQRLEAYEYSIRSVDELGRMTIVIVDLIEFDPQAQLVLLRRALEYLVQQALRTIGCQTETQFVVISTVRPTERIYDKDVRDIAITIRNHLEGRMRQIFQ
ncbi:hypothetical protein [Sulfobacillus thermosulfidooxidans]|uniref:hypothetical protein n=1 Tax=Sulfobacillus thermosulfidooxidans TaxID=28034 RepID=UPI00036FB476|nr:hypothetical protein [Sulfobacillus thermosulfidooxidans]